MILRVPVLVGLDVREAQIDAQVEEGYGPFQVIGLHPETEKAIVTHALKELQVRVQSALVRMGQRIQGSVDLRVPEGVRMCELDLAVALACLEAVGVVELPAGLYCRAELELGGDLRPVPGTFTALTRASRISHVVVSRYDLKEAEASGRDFNAHQSLADVASMFPPRRPKPFEPMPTRMEFHSNAFLGEVPDRVKAAALEGRDVLLMGQRISGRMMMARYYHSFLTLTPEQAVEVMQVQSIGCVLDVDRFKVPFRAPHHTVSYGGMAGAQNKPGEVSLSHHGVLVLDDLHEFRRDALEAVKAIKAKGYVTTPGGGTLPARFRIVATAPLCPHNHAAGACDCPGPLRERYEARLASVGALEVIRLP